MTKDQVNRITSMDQFRGYTVLGMILVNFVGGLAAFHAFFKHNQTWFSYADTIMPSFMFACGFSFRLSFLKRQERAGTSSTVRKFIWRSLGLVLVSLAMYGPNLDADKWELINEFSKVQDQIAQLLKAGLWETLAIIGCSQLLILPFIGRGFKTRFIVMIAFLSLHMVISHYFNFHFVYGKPNALDSYWGAIGKRAWDGGVFGLLGWSSMMLAGTLVHDIITNKDANPSQIAKKFCILGFILVVIAWGLTCFSRLYESASVIGEKKAENNIAASPVWPPFQETQAQLTQPSTWLAEPPFVAIPKERPHSYWMMNKRAVSLPFTIVSLGCALIVYAIFILWCDLKNGQWSVFRTFGQNPLASYVIHHMVNHSVEGFVPKDSPLWWASIGALLAIGLTYLLVRGLERQGIFVRL